MQWDTPSDDGGSPITGYQLLMIKNGEATYELIYDGEDNPATKIYTITSYKSGPLEKTIYNFKVRAFNWVGKSGDSGNLVVNVQTTTSAKESVVGGFGISTIEALLQTSVSVLAKDDTAADRGIGGDLFYIQVLDYCEVGLSFTCERVAIDHPKYNTDILTGPLNVKMVDNADGTYAADYIVNSKGWVKLNVFLMKSKHTYIYYINSWRSLWRIL